MRMKTLADTIVDKDIKYALCGHVHSGNHKPEPFGGVRNVVNVSIKDENYMATYNAFCFEL